MHALVTAGPTFEPIDAVRYLGNRSSGRLGCAIAAALAARGHRTTLLLGPSAQPPPERVELLRFETTAELAGLLETHWPAADLLVMAAAVADFRPQRADGESEVKFARTGGERILRLLPTPDLLAGCAGARRREQTLVGFALEARDTLLERARMKLRSKGIDAVVANPLETMDAGTIDGTLLLSDGSIHRPAGAGCVAKEVFAAWLAERLEALVAARGGSRRSAESPQLGEA